MGSMVYANFSVRDVHSKTGVSQQDFDAFTEFWEKQYEPCWVDNEPEFYQHYATDGMTIYARADVGKYFNAEAFLDFTKEHPNLQMEIIEEDYDHDERCRYLLEGEVFERLNEVRYFEAPTQIDWPG